MSQSQKSRAPLNEIRVEQTAAQQTQQTFRERYDQQMREQDAILGRMTTGLTTLGEIGKTMNSSLNQQIHMIREVDEKTETAQANLDLANRDLAIIKKRMKRNKWGLLIFLLVLIVILSIITWKIQQ
jgi:hypothetical protein